MAKKILVIDDDDRSRRLARDILVYKGHDVRIAAGGAEGVELAKAMLPDLVLLDIQMPAFDGFETLAALRAAGLGSTPVVAMTASVMSSERHRMAEAGFGGFVFKPITVKALLEALDDAGPGETND